MTRMLFRRAEEKDLIDIYRLAQSAGPGMTTLPNDLKMLTRRLKLSEFSFTKKVQKPDNEYYLFVLIDLEKNKVVGTSAIESVLGTQTPFYSYKIIKYTKLCTSLEIRNDYQLLELVNNYQGCSEICTLFLDPEYRHSGNGLLLSRSRFLFIANNPKRFSEKIIAEMRGVSNAKGRSPLWNAIGSNFFNMSFVRADRLTLSTNKQFIADLMPPQAIHINLLSKKAQDVIGKPHKSTVPAMKILLKEGFRYNEYVDIFDGGPTIEAICNQINTIKSSEVWPVSIRTRKIKSPPYLIANVNINFRSLITHASFTKTHCILDKETALLLQVQNDDLIRIISCK